MNNRTAATAALTLTAVLLLAGCSGATSSHDAMPGMDHGSTSAPPATTEANEADVMFATMMIPHHEQAVEMSEMLLAKSGIDERVTALAEQITAAQQPEIDKMQGWLDEWGVESSGGHDMHHGDGMMSDDDMQALQNASGDDAAQLFLSQMMEHHRGAVDMAQDEIDDGSDTAAVALAKTIVEAQMAEIAEMEQLRAKL